MQGTTKGIPIDTDATLSANSDALVSSQKAVKAYIDNTDQNFANTNLTFTGNRIHNTDGKSYELTTDNGGFAQGFQFMSTLKHEVGFGTSYTEYTESAGVDSVKHYVNGSVLLNLQPNAAQFGTYSQLGFDSNGALFRNCTEAQRDALTSVTNGTLIYNTDRQRFEFYEPFWGWHPVALTPSAMRDWGVEFIEDLHNPTPQSVWTSAGLNGGTQNQTAGYFGVATITTLTNTNGGYLYRGNINALQFGGGQYRFESRVRIPTNSDGTQTFQFLAGFYDTTSGINQTDGIYFLYDSQGVSTGSAASGNWQIVTASNSSRTFTTTAVAIDNVNLQKLRIDVNALATSVTFYINDVAVGTHTTNIPSGASRLTTSGVYLQKSAGTTARTADIDYLYLKAKFTTPR